MQKPINYRKKFPDLFKKPIFDDTLLKTLKKLGLSETQAKDQGFIQVAPSIKNGPLMLPSYWVHSDDMPRLEEKVAGLQKAVAKLEMVKHTTKAVGLLQNAFKSTIDTKSIENSQLKQFVEGLVANHAGTTIPVDAVASFLAWVLREELGLTQVNAIYISKKVFLHIEGISVEMAPDIFLDALLAGDLKEKVLAAISIKDQEVQDICQYWEAERPSWFSSKDLQKWAWTKVWHPASATTHPLMGHTVYGILLKKSVVHFEEIDKSLIISCHTAICNEAWKYTDVEKLIKDKPVILQKVAKQEMSQLISDLIAEENVEFLDKLGIDSTRWTGLVKTAVEKVCVSKFNPEDQKPLIKNMLKELIKEEFNLVCAQRCLKELPSHLKDYYPLARSLRREIVFIVGPTNSGKTYEAVNELARARCGVYLGPLRLLALEIRDTLIEKGVPTSLVTGEQVESVPGAEHTSSTIEMLNYSRPVDVAVVDEVQMIGDPQRGSAWLHAILGVPAKKVFLIGSPEAKDVIMALLKGLNEKVTVIEKARLNPLRVLPRPTPMSQIPEQSALIAFSRKEVLLLAQKLKASGRTVSVIYGSLPPEVRRKQSELFSSGKNELLVATDAIGLGLNLPIEGVYFTTSEKWNGQEVEKIDPHLVWQIAGRSGRFGHFKEGLVGAIASDTLSFIKNCLSQRPEPVEERYYCNLTFPIAEKIASHIGSSSLEHILKFYSKYMQLDAQILPVVTDDQIHLAKMLDRHTLSLAEKLLLSNAPAISGKYPDPYYEAFIGSIAKNKEFSTNSYLKALRQHNSLQDLESKIKSLNLYAWMHYRFEHIFMYMQDVRNELRSTNNEITNRLSQRKLDI